MERSKTEFFRDGAESQAKPDIVIDFTMRENIGVNGQPNKGEWRRTG